MSVPILKLCKPEDVCEIFKIIYPPGPSIQYIPRIGNFSEQGSFTFHTPGFRLFKIDSARVTSKSDIIEHNGLCLTEKFFRITAPKTKHLDINFHSFDYFGKTVTIRDPLALHTVPQALSLMGVHASHWGHFINEYLPMLLPCLGHLPGDVPILINEGLDPIMHELLMKSFILKGVNNPIILVPHGLSIDVGTLYFCDRSTFITEDSRWGSIYDIIVQYFAPIEMSKLRNMYKTDSKRHKIFLTRRSGARVCQNLNEIEDFFTRNGFQLFDTDQMDLRARIEVFPHCEQMVGIFGSSLANGIFCPDMKRCDIIAPLIRCTDQLGPSMFQIPDCRFHLAWTNDDSVHPSFEVTRESLESVVC